MTSYTEHLTLPAGLRSTTKTYNSVGQIIADSGPSGDVDDTGAAIESKTTYTYDAAGRMATKTEAAAAGPAAKLVTAYQYDTSGRLFRTIVHKHPVLDTDDPYALSAEDLVTETRYDQAGRVSETWAPPVDVTSYDWAAKTAERTAPDATVRITRYGFDSAGRQITVVDPLNNKTTTSYDADGRVESTGTAMGFTTTTTYDPLGRVTGVSTPAFVNGSAVTVTVDRAYDARGLMTSETDAHVHSAGDADPSARGYTYDAAGRVETVTDAAGHVVTYSYDGRGNRIGRSAIDDTGAVVKQDWVYDPAGHLVRQTLPHPADLGANDAGVKGTNYSFDTRGRLETASGDDGRTATFTYWNSGLARTKTDSGPDAGDVTSQWWYDARGHATKMVDPTGITTSSYDRSGAVTATTTPQFPTLWCV